MLFYILSELLLATYEYLHFQYIISKLLFLKYLLLFVGPNIGPKQIQLNSESGKSIYLYPINLNGTMHVTKLNNDKLCVFV